MHTDEAGDHFYCPTMPVFQAPLHEPDLQLYKYRPCSVSSPMPFREKVNFLQEAATFCFQFRLKTEYVLYLVFQNPMPFLPAIY